MRWDMKQTVLIFVASLMLVIAPAHAGKQSLRLNVQYDHTFYTLELDAKALRFQQNGSEFSTTLASCNEPLMKTYVKNVNEAAKAASEDAGGAPVWVSVETNGTKASAPKQVTRGSRLGTWLRELPRQVSYDFASAEASCQKR